jgi:hypothetical protein
LRCRNGFHKFATHPPLDDALLVTRLWDKHLPGWREMAANAKPPDKSERKKLIEELNRIEEAAKSGNPSEEIPSRRCNSCRSFAFHAARKANGYAILPRSDLPVAVPLRAY